MFVTTANSLHSIPPALEDRMEVIQLSGYTEEEKLQIARRHLVPKQLEEHGLTAEQIAERLDLRRVAALHEALYREVVSEAGR